MAVLKYWVHCFHWTKDQKVLMKRKAISVSKKSWRIMNISHSPFFLNRSPSCLRLSFMLSPELSVLFIINLGFTGLAIITPTWWWWRQTAEKTYTHPRPIYCLSHSTTSSTFLKILVIFFRVFKQRRINKENFEVVRHFFSAEFFHRSHSATSYKGDCKSVTNMEVKYLLLIQVGPI